MKIRVDVCIGPTTTEIDTAFLERRALWLSGTGIYLEFILKGEYQESYEFRVESDSEEIFASRHAWNRFFLNIQQSGTVTFTILRAGQVVATKPVFFKVEHIGVPLLFSVPELLSASVADIRFFANRIAENTVNGTRFALFTTRYMEGLASQDAVQPESFWKVFDLILSILTERGLKVYISPFDTRTMYTDTLIARLKPTLCESIEKSNKFKVVWDLSSGLRKKELGGFIDSLCNHYGKDMRLSTRADLFNRGGGEGFVQTFVEFRLEDRIPANDRGIKIARLKDISSDFYALRQFSKLATLHGWGVEYVPRMDCRDLKRLPYSLSRALYLGYCDSLGMKSEADS